MADEAGSANIEMNDADLYVEENFTDRRVGSLQRLSPVTRDGRPDPARATLYIGQTQVLTPAGALPLTFEIDAQSLEEAVKKFGDHAKQALASTMERLEELRREQASSLIVPGGGGPSGMGGPGGGIQMP